MSKDFTDFIVYIHDAGHRIYHIYHVRHGKTGRGEVVDLNNAEFPYNGYKYVLELDRAYPVRWAPWSHVIKLGPKPIKVKEEWFIGTVNGKIARIPVLAKRTKPRRFSVDIGQTISELVRSKKIGLLRYQMPCTHQCSTCVQGKADPEYCKTMPEDGRVYPMHISRTHQPSGELRG